MPPLPACVDQRSALVYRCPPMPPNSSSACRQTDNAAVGHPPQLCRPEPFWPSSHSDSGTLESGPDLDPDFDPDFGAALADLAPFEAGLTVTAAGAWAASRANRSAFKRAIFS